MASSPGTTRGTAGHSNGRFRHRHPSTTSPRSRTIRARDDWWHRKYTEDAEGRLIRLPTGGAEPDERGEVPLATPASQATDVAVADTATRKIHMPSPSYYPLVVAAGLPCLAYAAVFQEILWLIPGLVFLLFGAFAWGLEPSTEPEPAPVR